MILWRTDAIRSTGGSLQTLLLADHQAESVSWMIMIAPRTDIIVAPDPFTIYIIESILI